MRFQAPLIQTVGTEHTPVSLARRLGRTHGLLLFTSPAVHHSGRGGFHPGPDHTVARCDHPPVRRSVGPLVWPSDPAISLLVARPFLRFRSWGTRCEIVESGRRTVSGGNPWERLNELWTRYAQLESLDVSFPLGGCFGVWGYDLKNFVEPRLTRRALPDLGLPDCDLGFYDSLIVFDHSVGEVRIVSTGLESDGSRSAGRARQQAAEWHRLLRTPVGQPPMFPRGPSRSAPAGGRLVSTFSRAAYLAAVGRAQSYIRSGDIYQVNLAQRLSAAAPADPWGFCEQLWQVSPAPFSIWYDAGDYQIASVSPELFLRFDGRCVVTRPIKGTRRRDPDPALDLRLSEELRSSPKEQAELLMITDLMRNDLGRVCEYGSVTVPELMRLEPFAQVQHLVATVQGRLRSDVAHPQALAACFPGGSVTGAPKLRAMDIIDELEPVGRGPYTGALGYLGFNQQSQLSMVIRSAILCQDRVHFPVGAGIVADSDPAAEYDETLVKARAFLLLLEELEGGSSGAAGARAASRVQVISPQTP